MSGSLQGGLGQEVKAIHTCDEDSNGNLTNLSIKVSIA